jgi:hypothetical protein
MRYSFSRTKHTKLYLICRKKRPRSNDEQSPLYIYTMIFWKQNVENAFSQMPERWEFGSPG